MKKKMKIVLILIIYVMLIQGCGNTNLNNAKKGKESNKLIIAVSIVPEATFVREICGDKVDVIIMIPPGTSPENHETDPETIALFQDADIYFAIGVPTEEANIYSKINENTKLIRLDEIVKKEYEDRMFEDGGRDPHIWLSIKRVKVILRTMTEEISLLDEVNRKYYEENEKKYLKKIDTINDKIVEMVAGSEETSFIVYHPSFGYIADEFGFNMYSLEENGKEATAKHLQKLIDLAVEKKIKTVFYQSEVDSRQSKAFAEEIQGKSIELSPLASDYLENLEEMIKKILEGME